MRSGGFRKETGLSKKNMERIEGRIKYWNEISGRGVLKPLTGSGDFIFGHADVDEEGYSSFDEGEIVEFEADGVKARRIRKR